MIKLNGMSRAAALAALYNASRPQGMGFMHYDSTPMTEEQATELLERQTRFDYLAGRVMKVDLSKDEEFEERLYDRDNGQGAAQRAIDMAREKCDALIISTHREGVKRAAADVKARLHEPTRWEDGVLKMGLDHVADVLGPKIDQAEIGGEG